MAAVEHLLVVAGPDAVGADPLHMLFDEVAGPVGADDAAGVFCCGLRVVSVDGSSADGPPITVRVIEYTMHTSTAADSAGAEESSEVFALVTDLLDPRHTRRWTWRAPTRCVGKPRP